MLEELLILLKGVDDYYEDFFLGIKSDMIKSPELVEPMIDYMHCHPMATTSDIIGYLWRLEGISVPPLSSWKDDEPKVMALA